MKHTVIFLIGLLASVAAQAADVGVSISVGDPHFYGQINIGDFPPPELIYSQPVVVERYEGMPPPVYLRVPYGYERHWSKHCGAYHACGVPVYFVKDQWYRNVYAPRYQQYRHDGRPGYGNGHYDHHDDHGHDHNEDHGDHGHDHNGDHGNPHEGGYDH